MMNPYADEDVMWQRLKDSQREAENRRLMRAENGTTGRDLVKALASRTWLDLGWALTRGVRPRWWARTRPRGA